MTDNDQDLCNPARRAKRPSTAEPMSLQQPRAILPMPASAGEETTLQASPIWAKRARRSSNTSAPERPDLPRSSTEMADATEQPVLPPAAKRGRKPGPLSKSAREAQRRLNHSIIEKARRTKINDALATLKQLVPPDYLQMKQRAADAEKDDDEDDEDEDDYETNGKKTDKQKPKGKKQEKEKEFKLEILVRTVAFLQDLLKKVNDLETNNTHSWAVVCQNCGIETDGCRKRKRPDDDESSHDDGADNNTDRESSPSRTKVARMGDFPRIPPPRTITTASSPQGAAFTEHTERLPSISSWLNMSDIDPQLLPAPVMNKSYTFPINSSYLPSPPSSAIFDPVRTTTQVPPALNLGPVATAMSVSAPGLSPILTKNVDGHASTLRTPEDETAASMLLHIATSPSFRPVSASSTGYALPDPTNFSLHSNVRSRLRDEEHVRQVETPSSILGIKKY